MNSTTTVKLPTLSDEAARLQALDISASFIVEAPAGSGKTGLLTERYLNLLAHVEIAPEECLAITFTKKAAAELHHRVVEALQADWDAEQISPHQRNLSLLAKAVRERDAKEGWDLLNNPHRLKIMTIDAFSASLISRMPLGSSLGFAPKIVEEAFLLYEKASEQVVHTLESEPHWREAFGRLLIHLDNDLPLLLRLFSEMLAHREQWLPHIGQAFSTSECRELLENSLKKVIQEKLGWLVATHPKGMEELLSLARFAAKHVEEASPIRICEELNVWPDASLDALESWLGLKNLLLTEQDDYRKTVTERQGFPAAGSAKTKDEKALFQQQKQTMKDCLLKLEDNLEFKTALQELGTCPAPVLSDSQWVVLEALIVILPILVAELSLVFQKRGEMDFPELLMATLRSMGDNGEEGGPTDLSLKLDYQLRHLLVDEFQDTSLSQFRLLERLTLGWEEGRTLFLVGDPMQSIYRFRQAEVGLFLKVKEQGLNGIPLIPLTLTTNFRSLPVIIDWVNETFSAAFPKKPDSILGAIPYTKAIAQKVSNNGVQETCEVEDELTEANQIIFLVQKLQARTENESIALLVRARSHLTAILAAFKKEGIIYQGVSLEPLSESPFIEDLASLTAALTHLGDRLAWLSILRLPGINLSLHALFHLANWAPELPIWWALQHYTEITSLDEEDKTILARVVPILKEALAQTGQLPLGEWLGETWAALNNESLTPDSERYYEAEAFFSALEKVSAFHGHTHFLEPGALLQQLSQTYLKPRASDEATLQGVQVMTIHKAKGLEFDNVIVAGVNRKLRSDTDKLLLWEERLSETAPYLLLGPIQAKGSNLDPLYAFLKDQQKKRLQYESKRLLYVAATRAKKRLYWMQYR